VEKLWVSERHQGMACLIFFYKFSREAIAAKSFSNKFTRSSAA
jgi:hypothetical protein